MKKGTFTVLLDLVRERYNPTYVGGEYPISPKLCLQLGLWYLGNKSTYREIAELFGISEAAAYNCVQRVIDIICSVGSRFIK